MAEVLHRAVWAQVRPATEPLVVPRGARKWRIPSYAVQDVLDEARRFALDGGGKPIEERREKALFYFSSKLGVSHDIIFRKLAGSRYSMFTALPYGPYIVIATTMMRSATRKVVQGEAIVQHD